MDGITDDNDGRSELLHEGRLDAIASSDTSLNIDYDEDVDAPSNKDEPLPPPSRSASDPEISF